MNNRDDVVLITLTPIVYFHLLQDIYFAQYGVEMDIKKNVQYVESALENGEI